MKRRSLVLFASCVFLGACGAEPVSTAREDAGRVETDANAGDVGGSGDAGEMPDAGSDSATADSATADSGPPIPDDLASRYCDAYDDYGTMCSVPGAGADCDTGETCVVDALRSDVAEPLVLCLEGRACGDSDGPCFDIDTFGVTPSSAAADFTTECLARHEECAGSFEEAHCGYAVLSDATLERYAYCLRTNCAGINSCVGRIIGCIDE